MNSEYRAGLEQWPEDSWRRLHEVQQQRLAAERSSKMAMYAGLAPSLRASSVRKTKVPGSGNTD